MRAVLREPSLDPAFKALALTLPSEIYIAEQLDSVDPQRVHAAREAMKRQLATALVDDWQWAFDAHQVSGGYSPDPVSAGRACARQPRLAMLCMAARQSGDAVWPGRAWQRFKDAGNMTDRQGALMALMASGSVLADAAFERFHAIFRNDALVARQVVRPAGRRAGARGQGVRAGEAPARPPDFKLANPEPGAQPDRHLLPRQPGGLSSRRRRRLRLLGGPGDRPRRHQSAGRVAHRPRPRPLEPPRRALSLGGAGGDRAGRGAAKLSDDTHEIVSRALAGA
jgi:aminopeptidase N